MNQHGQHHPHHLQCGTPFLYCIRNFKTRPPCLILETTSTPARGVANLSQVGFTFNRWLDLVVVQRIP
jgi:hypothetical protein